MKGFTLLEVLTALAVVGLAMVVLLQTDGLNLERTLHATRLTEAVQLAREKVEETFSRGVPEFPEEETPDESGIYRLTMEILDAEFPGVVEVRVVVRWNEGEREESYSVVAFLPE
ncbi:MAG: prepilin-type N-terminal cleavage/methylation domain-containing protein [bacterium]|nr:MAG: prepilin-type N-terminal cleavage/methylation domain-containing protein [bacterium]